MLAKSYKGVINECVYVGVRESACVREGVCVCVRVRERVCVFA